jgi:hypothetical protein
MTKPFSLKIARLACRIRKDLILLVEQPASSWAFKMPMLIKLAKEWNM